MKRWKKVTFESTRTLEPKNGSCASVVRAACHGVALVLCFTDSVTYSFFRLYLCVFRR